MITTWKAVEGAVEQIYGAVPGDPFTLLPAQSY